MHGEVWFSIFMIRLRNSHRNVPGPDLTRILVLLFWQYYSGKMSICGQIATRVAGGYFEGRSLLFILSVWIFSQVYSNRTCDTNLLNLVECSTINSPAIYMVNSRYRFKSFPHPVKKLYFELTVWHAPGTQTAHDNSRSDRRRQPDHAFRQSSFGSDNRPLCMENPYIIGTRYHQYHDFGRQFATKRQSGKS